MFLFDLRSKFSQDLNFFLFGTLFLRVEDTRCGDWGDCTAMSHPAVVEGFETQISCQTSPSLLHWIILEGVVFVSFLCLDIKP